MPPATEAVSSPELPEEHSIRTTTTAAVSPVEEYGVHPVVEVTQHLTAVDKIAFGL